MLTRQEFQAIYEQGPDAVFAEFATLQKHKVLLIEQTQLLEEQTQLLTARLHELEDAFGELIEYVYKPPSNDGLLKKPPPLRPRMRRPG